MDIYQSVWSEADALRKSGRLVQYGKKIQRPVTVIHGEYDPSPYEGIEKPLSSVLNNPRFILLKKCGHHPWFEKEARGEFYDRLKEEIADRSPRAP